MECSNGVWWSVCDIGVTVTRQYQGVTNKCGGKILLKQSPAGDTGHFNTRWAPGRDGNKNNSQDSFKKETWACCLQTFMWTCSNHNCVSWIQMRLCLSFYINGFQKDHHCVIYDCEFRLLIISIRYRLHLEGEQQRLVLWWGDKCEW